MSNWKPQVFVQGSWASNALVFATEREALANARDLMGRWLLVEDYRAVKSGEPVNYTYSVEGVLHAVPTAEQQKIIDQVNAKRTARDAKVGT